MDLDEIKRIIQLMDEHDLSHFHLEQDGVKIKLTKGMNSDEIANMLTRAREAQGPPPALPEPGPPGGDPAPLPEPEDDFLTIPAPIVGTYYKSASPESAPFVKIGDRVTEDTVVCIIEAMKVMNEIKAEISGIIDEVLVDNGQVVEFGQPLFKVRVK